MLQSSVGELTPVDFPLVNLQPTLCLRLCTLSLAGFSRHLVAEIFPWWLSRCSPHAVTSRALQAQILLFQWPFVGSSICQQLWAQLVKLWNINLSQQPVCNKSLSRQNSAASLNSSYLNFCLRAFPSAESTCSARVLKITNHLYQSSLFPLLSLELLSHIQIRYQNPSNVFHQKQVTFIFLSLSSKINEAGVTHLTVKPSLSYLLNLLGKSSCKSLK